MIAVARQVSQVFAVDEGSQVGAARRGVAALAQSVGLAEDAVSRASIVATELSTNLLGHAREGRLVARALDGQGVEMLAIDGGPGIRDIEQCLRDGFSTGGTPGNGLGAIRRQADSFDISSQVAAGTVVLARIQPSAGAAHPLRIGVVCVPHPGETECGDGWEWHAHAHGGTLLMVDGIGHGKEAARATRVALDTFRSDPTRPPEQALQALHREMQGTRGAAAAIAQIDLERGRLRYAGVGNIGGTLVGAERRRGLPSHNGILGSIASRMQAFEYPWQAGDMLVMHTDGLISRWSLDDLPGAALRDPSIIAGLLYRDFNRGRDDIAVAVVTQP
jgi:anti-sigma regulatory factor (Ser/Thr protein kinase)